MPVTLHGRFVRLEPLGLAHVPALVAAAAGPRGTYDLTHVPADEARMCAYVESALRDRDAGRAAPFATVDLRAGAGSTSGVVVGTTRFGNLEYWTWPEPAERGRPADVPDAVEIGWTWLAERAQRTAINSEAKLLMLDHAFDVWRVHRVTLKTDRRNQRSRAAIERLGAQLDGVLRAHMPAAAPFISAMSAMSDAGARGVRDSAVYSILAAEWPSLRERLCARLVAIR
jgi:RimJ/RimL family protein N-acetyltransferase